MTSNNETQPLKTLSPNSHGELNFGKDNFVSKTHSENAFVPTFVKVYGKVKFCNEHFLKELIPILVIFPSYRFSIPAVSNADD